MDGLTLPATPAGATGMDRVTFLIEATGERVSCLLNPESLTLTRRAGLRDRAGPRGALTGAAGSHDPLIATGGGITELELHLLFDTELARSLDPRPDEPGQARADVRALTRPLLALAEPRAGSAEPSVPVVRFIWGQAWNLPAVVLAVAERLERFSPGGVPGRSWMSLRLRQVPEAETAAAGPLPPALPDAGEVPGLGSDAIEAVADAAGNAATPIYLAAYWLTGRAEDWPQVAAASGIEDPLRIEAGTVFTAGSAGATP